MPARDVHVCGNGSAVDLIQRLSSLRCQPLNQIKALMKEQVELSTASAVALAS